MRPRLTQRHRARYDQVSQFVCRPGQSTCEASTFGNFDDDRVVVCRTQRPVPGRATDRIKDRKTNPSARSGSVPDAVAAAEGMTMTADESFEHLHVNKRAKVRAPSEAQDVPLALGSAGEDKAFEHHHHMDKRAKVPHTQLVIHGAKTLVGAADGTDECTTDYWSAKGLSGTGVPERLPGTSTGGMTLTAGSKNPNRLARGNSPTASPGAGCPKCKKRKGVCLSRGDPGWVCVDVCAHDYAFAARAPT